VLELEVVVVMPSTALLLLLMEVVVVHLQYLEHLEQYMDMVVV
jgi:hypothetical protein